MIKGLPVNWFLPIIFAGNNGSALVEVLVGRSSWSSDEQFQVRVNLLVF